jgi:hypothetical protein
MSRIVAFGEVLWDLLPTGPVLGGGKLSPRLQLPQPLGTRKHSVIEAKHFPVHTVTGLVAYLLALERHQAGMLKSRSSRIVRTHCGPPPSP